jgi:hypothetical protein
MDRNDPAYKGQRDDSAALLNAYDPLVLAPNRPLRLAMPIPAGIRAGWGLRIAEPRQLRLALSTTPGAR